MVYEESVAARHDPGSVAACARIQMTVVSGTSAGDHDNRRVHAVLTYLNNAGTRSGAPQLAELMQEDR
jgi:hypothetical protein